MVPDLAVGPRSESHFVSSVNAREVVPALRGPHATHAFLSKSTRPNAARPRLARDRHNNQLIHYCQATAEIAPGAPDPVFWTAPRISSASEKRKPVCRFHRNVYEDPSDPVLCSVLCRPFEPCMLDSRSEDSRKESREGCNIFRWRTAGPEVRWNGARYRLARSRSPGAWP